MKFAVLLDDLGHFFVMTRMTDNATLSDTICWRRSVRFVAMCLVKTAHPIYAFSNGLAPDDRTTIVNLFARQLGWALARGRDPTESDAAFAAGITLKSAAIAAKMLGRSRKNRPSGMPFC